MGRYDKIRVYDNGWKQPSRIRVMKNGSWVDLGDNDSTNNTDFNVYKLSSSKFVRATLDKKVTPYSYSQGTGYTESSWSPGFDCGFSPTSSYGGFRFEFTATVYRRDSAKRCLYSSKAKYGTHYCYIDLNADGSITFKIYTDYSSYGEVSVTTSAKLSLDQWGSLRIVAEKDSATVSITWCGATVTCSSRRAWQVSSNTTINPGGARISISGFKLQTYSNNTGGTQSITSTAAEIKNQISGNTVTWV